jgi:hypothetical protein
MLMGDILSHYWCQSIQKNFGFVWNTKQEQFVLSTIFKVKDILDSNVTLPTHGSGVALVTSNKHALKGYWVYNPNFEWACCECLFAQQGNICKHQIKVLMMMHLKLVERLLHIIVVH